MSPESWRETWVAGKCQIAMRLATGEAGGGYAEAALLLCATLSAQAAEIWPGTSIDRVRFIELLAKIGPESGTCRSISVPLLVQHLEGSGRKGDATKLRQTFAISEISRVLVGSEVDQEESDVLTVCPALDLEEIRRFSYASILYGDVRSSYAHQYQPGDRADSLPMTTRKDSKVSYINRLCNDLVVRRLLHFHIEWLSTLPASIATASNGLAPIPQPQPNTWWGKGG